MREIVLLGEPEWLNEKLAQIQTQIDQIADSYGLPAHWETAEDPFFLPTAKGKALMQRLMETKKELVCDEPDQLAIASINRHGTFFGQRFAILRADKTPVQTACVAFGLDRWAALELRQPMNDKTKVLERLRQTIPRLAADFAPERRLDELGADSIDLVELLVVIDSGFWSSPQTGGIPATRDRR